MQKDIILKLDGRMANQMFQWAFARALEEKLGFLPLIDDSKETLKLNCFNLMKDLKTVDKPTVNKILRKIIPIRNLRNKLTELKFNLKEYQEENFLKFDDNFLNIQPPAYIKGFFQSEKYFKNIRQKLINDFKIIKKPNKKNLEMLDKIKSKTSISLHLRRTDYLKKRVSNFMGMCSCKYYKNAVDIIKNKINQEPCLFIFSDDINWVKNNVKFDCETIYADINCAKQGYFDLELMKNCSHNIIANSSFSWWGAWLNENPDKIIVAPTPWCQNGDENDIVCNTWIKLNKTEG